MIELCEKLALFFKAHPKSALAFSGGTDSAFLLHFATKCSADVKPYYAKSAFQPQFELDDALRLANDLGIELAIIDIDVLKNDAAAANPPNRCYFCKQTIFSVIKARAAQDGYQMLIDGTNASDSASDRPGIRALQEMAVLSPLRDCGLTKKDIRALSKEAGLFTWNKPAYACLATRIKTGEPITEDTLKVIEKAENYLFSLGFTDFRARVSGNSVRLEIPASQMPKVIELREGILTCLKQYYSKVLLDLEARSTSQ